MNKGKRDIRFDIIRVISMVYIIFVFHFVQYTNYHEWYESRIAELMTSIALSCFTFISGYFSHYSFRKCNSDVLQYYSDRLLRIYPLFVLSALSLLVINYIESIKEFVFTCFGHAGCLIGTSPRTVWYVCMLLLFYLITPLILLAKRIRTKIIYSFLVFCAVISVVYLGKGDERVLVYYPIYVGGVLSPTIAKSDLVQLITRIVLSKPTKMLIGCSFLVLIAALFFIRTKFDNIIIKYITKEIFLCVSLCVIWLLTCIVASYLKKWNKTIVFKIIGILSYASFSMYLFHRVVYAATVRIMGGGYIPVVSVIALFPIITSISYYIQFSYDSILSSIINRH